MQEKIIGKCFEDMQLEDMENVFGGSNEAIQPRATPAISLIVSYASAAAVTSGVGSYLVTAVFCK